MNATVVEGQTNLAAEALKMLEQGIDPSELLRNILEKNIRPTP